MGQDPPVDHNPICGGLQNWQAVHWEGNYIEPCGAENEAACACLLMNREMFLGQLQANGNTIPLEWSWSNEHGVQKML